MNRLCEAATPLSSDYTRTETWTLHKRCRSKPGRQGAKDDSLGIAAATMRGMSLPISTWALIAGVVASAVTVIFSGTVLNPAVPKAVFWLGAWGASFAAQAASWMLLRKATI